MYEMENISITHIYVILPRLIFELCNTRYFFILKFKLLLPKFVKNIQVTIITII